MRERAQLEAAIRPDTRMIWVESPSNPLLKLVDLEMVAEVARARGVLAVADNTFATPCVQRPLEFGFDAVLHSVTKYLNGHSDMVGGAIVIGDNAALAEQLAFLQNAVGAVLSPFDSFLALRGLKTLHLRMARHCENALAIAERRSTSVTMPPHASPQDRGRALSRLTESSTACARAAANERVRRHGDAGAAGQSR